MNEHDAFPSAHLKWEDLQDRPARLTIASVEMGEVGQGRDKETKPIVSFNGTEKTLVLNKTNFNRIAHITQQEDTDDWTGCQITLFVDVTDFQGKTVNCIRVQMGSNGAPPVQATQLVQQPAQLPPPSPDLDMDDIPF